MTQLVPNRRVLLESEEHSAAEIERVDERTPSEIASGSLEQACTLRGMRMTEQRRVIARVLEQAHDHPDVEELHRRVNKFDPTIAISTVYRTLRLFEEAGMIERHDFRDGRARYEPISETHHDHLIDLRSGIVIEFRDEQIEKLQEVVARLLGYRLVDHRLELYGVPLEEVSSSESLEKKKGALDQERPEAERSEEKTEGDA